VLYKRPSANGVKRSKHYVVETSHASKVCLTAWPLSNSDSEINCVNVSLLTLRQDIFKLLDMSGGLVVIPLSAYHYIFIPYAAVKDQR
jgi:hypothetical protein